MRALSPKRRLSITRNTSYPSVASERRPSELGNISQANYKSMSHELDTNRQRIEKMHSKSLSELDHQRKLLEKSMLAYTDKMKEAMDSRTNRLFRGIQIKVAINPEKVGPRSLPANVELTELSSIPVNSAKLRKQRIHIRRYGAMSDRGGCKAPIEEERESEIKPDTREGTRIRSISADTLRRARMTRVNTEYNSMRAGVRYSSPSIMENTVKLPLIPNPEHKHSTPHSKRNKDTYVNANNTKDTTKEPSLQSTKSCSLFPAISKDSDEIIRKPRIHIVNDDTQTVQGSLNREASFYRNDSASDSAYSSCTDDDEGWSTADDSVSDKSEHKSKSSVRWVEPNPQEGNLLTIPRVHKRKRLSKGGKSDKASKTHKDNTLLRKAILKNASSSQEKNSQKDFDTVESR